MTDHDRTDTDWHDALERLDAPDALQVRGATPAANRRARRRFRPLTVVAVAAVASLFGMTAAWAYTPFFNDNEGTPFQYEIDWLGSTGITNGYPDGSFRPTQNISRQALSAWMQRLYNLRDDTGVANSATSFLTASTTSVDVTNAIAVVRVPEGTAASLVGNFSAESACYGAGGYCRAAMFFNRVEDADPAVEMQPVAFGDFAFDSSDSNSEGSSSWEGHAFQRTWGYLTAGTYEVTVRVSVEAGMTLRLDDWSLVAETTLYRTDAVL